LSEGPQEPSSQDSVNSTRVYIRQEYLKARNLYFQAIKAIKRDHWNLFLENEDPKIVFKALKYTKSTRVERIPSILEEVSFKGKAKVFRETLFPRPPASQEPDWLQYNTNSIWKWPSLDQYELELACSTKVKGKTPGPDNISQELVTRAYKAIPQYFYKLYKYLINIGYYPKV
jgi:hypothetical protein